MGIVQLSVVAPSVSSPIRIAVLSDVHGNRVAFDAALRRVRELSPDLLVFGGDIVNGSPDSRDCWDMALGYDAPLLRGNHERYIHQADRPDRPAEWALERFAPVRWTAERFTPAERATMGELPLLYRHPGLPEILFCHGSPRNDNDAILAHTPEPQLAEMLAGMEEPLLIRGHNHAAQTRFWQGKMIVTCGSVGLPLDHFPTAQFLLLERRGGRWETLHQSVEYDLRAAARRFEETGYLRDVGPVARLSLREVMTASFHWVPFLKTYSKWSPDHSLPLGTAIERFLNEDTF
ncbi:MAG: metallophosphoesterase family protein [Capsulimonadales bacterium]|nr:metallophosphoesterase family protein [Capsulimonadales bacterium]